VSAQGPGFSVGGRAIGPGERVYVIAELGVNHDGDAGASLELVDAAADAGADAVKLQLFRADLLVSRDAGLAGYQRAAGERSQRAMLERLELDERSLGLVVERARSRGLGAVVTPFSVELVGAVVGLGFDAVKSASPDVVNRPLLDAIVSTGLAMIVSTGASTAGEVARAAGWLDARSADGRSPAAAFLQCVSAYPASEPALDGIAAVAVLTRRVAGYSDHTPDVETGARAVAHGAAILEKHLTLDRSRKGPDHAASLDPPAFARYVQLARDQGVVPVPAACDTRAKRVLECERDVRRTSRQSLVAARDLALGQVIGLGDVSIKRPGTGLEPWLLDEVVGRRLARALNADSVIDGHDLDPPIAIAV